MNKFLYGASVQGIQEFIFKTNKLQEIVGASEIVKNITDDFEKKFKNNVDVEILLCAAGNIKAIFHDKDLLQKHILNFEKEIMKSAYGITISQAVVETGDSYTQDDIDKLAKKLKTQRNKPSIPLDMSINLMKLNPPTAKPLVNKDEDRATIQKRQAYADWFKKQKIKEKDFEKSKELSYISNNKNKIAVIHIDGNGLGQLIPKLEDYGLELSEFSKKLDEATKKAFNDARDESMSIREIVLGGDDVTIICSADDALKFTRNFLDNFERETKNSFTKLTACAGISYCNEKYPFHYAVDLAEELCGVAKKLSERKSSCLMFHNIQSSNYQSWDKFVKDELTIKNDKQTIKCDFGAYYLKKDGEAEIQNFINTLEAYRCDGSPISRLRNWLSELYKNDTNAKNLLHRINQITQEKDIWNCEIMDKNLKFFNKNLSNNNLIVKKDGEMKTPIYDILQILSITEAKK